MPQAALTTSMYNLRNPGQTSNGSIGTKKCQITSAK